MQHEELDKLEKYAKIIILGALLVAFAIVLTSPAVDDSISQHTCITVQRGC